MGEYSTTKSGEMFERSQRTLAGGVGSVAWPDHDLRSRSPQGRFHYAVSLNI